MSECEEANASVSTIHHPSMVLHHTRHHVTRHKVGRFALQAGEDELSGGTSPLHGGESKVNEPSGQGANLSCHHNNRHHYYCRFYSQWTVGRA